MSELIVDVGNLRFSGRLESSRAPRTCAAFRRLLPFQNHLIQARWSGQAGWVPLGDLQLGLGEENATASPAPGELLLYPAGISETEILFPYGLTRFASKEGELRGNHFLTITGGREQLGEVGDLILWKGAQPIRIYEP